MRSPGLIWSPKYEMDIGPHVFPTQKFRLVKEALVASGDAAEADFEAPSMPTEEELLRVLAPEYLDDLFALRKTDRTIRSELPLTPQIVEGCLLTAGGSILSVRRAIERGAACHLGGGFHHGFADHGEGFCYINDVAIAAAAALAEGLCRRVAILDTDLHQGNGTARIFSGNPDVFTFSIHQENLYPAKETSTLDVGVEDWAGDEEYLGKLSKAIKWIYESFDPQLVLYVGGVDVYERDRLGDLKLTRAGIAQRDNICLAPAARNRIPFVTLFAGGYAEDVADTVALHVQTVRAAKDLLARAG